MCDLVTSFAHHMLLPMADLATLIKDLPEEVEKMKVELDNIRTSIYREDRMGAAEKTDKERVQQLVEKAFRLEDTIDDYMICEQWQPAHDPPFAALPSEAAGFIKTMSLRVQTACKIKFFNWQKQRNEKDDHGLQASSSKQEPSSSSDTAVQRFQDDALFLNEADFVGFEAPKQTLTDWLVNGENGRTVISVVAIGGQGKTTLANQVFNNQQVVEHFPYRAWVTVSQKYTVEGLLKSMLKEFYKGQNQSTPNYISNMTRVELKTELRNYLQEKRYVIFFDDVWNKQFWGDVGHALIDNKLGSRVFITTRDGDVNNSCKESSVVVKVHKLKPLTEEKSLELFNKKAFYELKGCCCPPHLENISSKIVNKCNGLPLALVAIGGVLAGKERDVVEWENFHQNLSSELEDDSNLNGVGRILGFSYNDLPPHLKPCLLYFGMYPEDYEVRSDRVIRQWIAEGFIKEEKRRGSLEKVAQEYLKELIRRSLVQASSFTVDGTVTSCRVHDLIRDLILTKNKDLSFGQFITEDNLSGLSSVTCRRISLTTDSNEFMKSSSSYICSLIFFIVENFPEHFMRIIPAKYTLLKVLDFEVGGLYDIGVPETLGTLIHLRYLSFRGTWIKKLPASIVKLENLESLDIMGTNVKVLPKGIGKLSKLRHLLSRPIKFAAGEDSIGGMTSLQTLRDMCVDGDGGALIRDLGKLMQLRSLGLFIADEFKDDERALSNSLVNKLQHLEELQIWVGLPDADLLHLHSISTPKLRVLQLESVSCNFPTWSTSGLVDLTMENCPLTQDDFISLQNMPCLLSLSILSWRGDGGGDTTTLHVQDRGFPNLKHLRLQGFSELEFFNVERGALPSLETLTLRKIPKLNKLPEHLKNLKRLDVDMIFTILEIEDSQIIQHVPPVQVYEDDDPYSLDL